MIVCPRCSKENQDHYMFCLGCGTELKGAGGGPKPFKPSAAAPSAAPKPSAAAGGPARPGGGLARPGGAPAPAAAAPAGARRGSDAPAAFGGAAAAAATPDVLTCPRCSTSVPKAFRFCGSCGFDMTTVAAAPAAAAAPGVVHDLPTNPVRLVLIRPDGSEGESIAVTDDFIVGRDAGGPFAGDSYLSPRHARIHRGKTSYAIEDLGSLNGVYLRLERDVPEPLFDGSVFRIGQEIIQFDAIPAPKKGPNDEDILGSPDPGFLGRISLVVGRNTYGNSYPVPPDGMHLGRERGDIIFPDDGYVSGLHCRIHAEHGQVYLTDVGSSNGSFIRLTRETPLRMGNLLLLGQQLFRIEA